MSGLKYDYNSIFLMTYKKHDKNLDSVLNCSVRVIKNVSDLFSFLLDKNLIIKNVSLFLGGKFQLLIQMKSICLFKK